MSTVEANPYPHHDDVQPRPNADILFANKFLSLRAYRGYTYMHMDRSDGHLIVVLPYRQLGPDTFRFLSHVEICPAHSDAPDRYSITGGAEKGVSYTKQAVIEVREETGYDIHEAELMSLGIVRPSKQSDTVAHLYAVNMAGKTAGEITGDNSYWERDTKAQWLSEHEALQVVDPLFITSIARLKAALQSKI